MSPPDYIEEGKTTYIAGSFLQKLKKSQYEAMEWPNFISVVTSPKLVWAVILPI